MKIVSLITYAFFALVPSSLLAGDRFPGTTWMQYADPEEAGFSAPKLIEAEDYWESLDSAALLVTVDGAVLIAWGDVERRFLLHSARKSVMSAIYGRMVDAGRIDLDRTMEELGIDDMNPALTEAERAATIHDLIRARSGIYHLAAAEPPENSKPEPGAYEPGSKWCYNNWDFNALCTILEQEAEVKFFEEVERVFAIPLGMQDYRARDGFYLYERNKSIHPAYHIRMSARDLARFGHLFLRLGVWQGERILSEEWVDESTFAHSTDAWGGDGYGYMWWVSQKEPFAGVGMYSALGVGEQSIDVLPGANMVVVHRTDTFDGHQVTGRERLALIRKLLAARVGEPAADPELVPLPLAPPAWKPVSLSDQLLEASCGELQFPRWGAVTVRREAELLLFDSPMGLFGLIPLAENLFLLEDVNTLFYFEREPDGRVSRVVTEQVLNIAGYEHLQRGEIEEAIAVFVRAVGYFPESANLHDSLGEAYLAGERWREALASYRRSLELDPGNEGAVVKIEELEARLRG